MDMDDHAPLNSGTPLAMLAREDLDPLSLDELHARIAALETEIARSRARIERAVNHRASAESLFRQ